MTEALITGVVAIAVCMINNYFQQKSTKRANEFQQQQTREANQETINMINYKLEELTKRVDKHNNTIERTYRLEELAAVQGEQIKVANHRIQDLEEKER